MILWSPTNYINSTRILCNIKFTYAWLKIKTSSPRGARTRHPPHVQYDKGPLQEACNRQWEVSPCLICGNLKLSMQSVFLSYMTFMVPPYLIWNRYLMVPLTLYGTGIVCPHMYVLSPHMYDVIFSGQLIWSPNMYVWSPTYKSYGPPYLIWNRYLMVPLTLYGTGIVCPHMYVLSPHMYDVMFSGQLIWSPNMYVWSPTYKSYGPPIPYMV